MGAAIGLINTQIRILNTITYESFKIQQLMEQETNIFQIFTEKSQS